MAAIVAKEIIKKNFFFLSCSSAATTGMVNSHVIDPVPHCELSFI